MKTLRTRLALIAAALSVLTMLAGPATAGDVSVVATESVEEADGAAEEGNDKIQLPESSHHKFGAVILIASGIIGLLVLDNVRRRLKGEGEKATGEFRWR